MTDISGYIRDSINPPDRAEEFEVGEAMELWVSKRACCPTIRDKMPNDQSGGGGRGLQLGTRCWGGGGLGKGKGRTGDEVVGGKNGDKVEGRAWDKFGGRTGDEVG